MLLQLIVSGILLGGIYALLSVGLSLMLGVSKFLNFAHGDFVMVGMYMAFICYQNWGVNSYLSWPIVTLFAAALGVIVFAFSRLTIGQGNTLNQILLTLGLSMVLQNVMLLLYKSDYKSVPNALSGSIQVQEIFISTGLLITFIIALCITAVFLCFIQFTSLGRAMRAVGEDRHASQLMGIPVGKVDLVTFCLGITMACISGSLMMSVYPVTPSVGSGYNLIAWVTVVLGGLGHLQGALLSALLIGICETVSGFYLGADLRQVVYFVVFLLVLIVRPQGLFSGFNMKKVKRS